MAMPCIRLEDKLNRLKALTRNGNQQVNDESIDDTLMDLANYAIMTLVERRIAEAPADVNHQHCPTCKYEKVPIDYYPCNGCCYAQSESATSKWEAKENASD